MAPTSATARVWRQATQGFAGWPTTARPTYVQRLDIHWAFSRQHYNGLAQATYLLHGGLLRRLLPLRRRRLLLVAPAPRSLLRPAPAAPAAPTPPLPSA